MQGLSLARNFAWNVGGNAVYAGTRWGVIAALANLFDARSVGLYGLGVAISAPVFALLGMNLRAIVTTDRNAEFAFHDYLAARLASTAVAVAASAVLVLASGYRAQAFAVILLLAGLQAIESLADIAYGLFQQVERLDLTGKSVMFRGPARLAALAAAATLSNDLVIAILAELAASTLVLVAFDFTVAKRVLRERGGERLRPVWNHETQARLFRLALPMAGLIVIASLQLYLPRYALEIFRSTEDLGIFVALTALASTPLPVINALCQSASPRLARHWANGHLGAFHILHRRLLLAATAMGVLGILAASLVGRQALELLYTRTYAAHDDLLVWLMIASLCVSATSVYGIGITAMRTFQAPFVVQALLLVAAVPAYAWLARHHGGIGASWAISVHALLTSVGLALLMRTTEAGR